MSVTLTPVPPIDMQVLQQKGTFIRPWSGWFRNLFNYLSQFTLTATNGSFTGTPTGGTGFSPATVTITWVRLGNFVGMTVPATTGTSNATTFTITGTFPAALIPATATKFTPCTLLKDNGAAPTSTGYVNVASGVLTFGFALTSNSWTAAGNKGISSNTNFVYSLD